MSRETKVGMLVGLGVILLIGIIVSDHLSVANKQQTAKQLTDMAPKAQEGLVAKGGGDPAINPENRATTIPLPGEPKNAIPAAETNGPAKDHSATVVFDGKPNTAAPKGQLATATGGVPILTMGNKVEADAGQSHVVKQGDSLYAIAKLYYKSATPTQIALVRDANKGNIGKGDALKLGTKLVIPALPAKSAPTPAESAAVAAAGSNTTTPTAGVPANDGIFTKPVATASAPNTVTVEKGQSLGTIAAKYLGSASRWTEIKALNKGVDPTNLKIGQKLVLPAAKADAEAKASTKTETAKTDTKGKSSPVAVVTPAGPAMLTSSSATSPLAPTLPARLAPAASGNAGPAVSSATGSTPASIPAPATPIASVKAPTL